MCFYYKVVNSLFGLLLGCLELKNPDQISKSRWGERKENPESSEVLN